MNTSNFELVQKYGCSVFVIHKFLEEYPNASFKDIELATGLSDGCIKKGLKTLAEVNLLNKKYVSFSKYGNGYRYSIQ